MSIHLLIRIKRFICRLLEIRLRLKIGRYLTSWGWKSAKLDRPCVPSYAIVRRFAIVPAISKY